MDKLNPLKSFNRESDFPERSRNYGGSPRNSRYNPEENRRPDRMDSERKFRRSQYGQNQYGQYKEVHYDLYKYIIWIWEFVNGLDGPGFAFNGYFNDTFNRYGPFVSQMVLYSKESSGNFGKV